MFDRSIGFFGAFKLLDLSPTGVLAADFQRLIKRERLISEGSDQDFTVTSLKLVWSLDSSLRSIGRIN
jgi:hypothetical protein